MNALAAIGGGIAGAVALNILHESVRHVRDDAPRMDILGELAIARGMEAVGVEPPPREALYVPTLVGDLVSNRFAAAEMSRSFRQPGSLTGEPYPAEKEVSGSATGAQNPPGASNALFAGTSVISGTATILICRTGARSALGGLATSLTEKPPATAFVVPLPLRFYAYLLGVTAAYVSLVEITKVFFYRWGQRTLRTRLRRVSFA